MSRYLASRYQSTSAPLSTYDWVRMLEPELRARGYDPAARVCYTGHETAMRWQWVASIGCWGSREALEMISKTEPHRALLHVTYAAFKQFKVRHGLLTGQQFARTHGSEPWAKAELCANELARAERVLGLAGNRVPIGSACAYAVATARKPIGLLAVEVVLWARLFDDLLSHHALGIDDWLGLSKDDKTMLWENGPRDEPPCLQAVAHAPAVLHLPEEPLAAAE